LTKFGKIVNPEGIQTLGEFPNLTEALLQGGFSERQTQKIMGDNWVDLLRTVWGETES
jgi:membrane dipeptidase